jgi:predicted O-methyltransferase YrrM
LADLVEIRIGDALETLRNGIDGDVDLVLLDGAFSLYLPVLKLLEPYLRDGAFVIGDNALEQSPGYLATTSATRRTAIYRYHCRSMRVEVMNSL